MEIFFLGSGTTAWGEMGPQVFNDKCLGAWFLYLYIVSERLTNHPVPGSGFWLGEFVKYAPQQATYTYIQSSTSHSSLSGLLSPLSTFSFIPLSCSCNSSTSLLYFTWFHGFRTEFVDSTWRSAGAWYKLLQTFNKLKQTGPFLWVGRAYRTSYLINILPTEFVCTFSTGRIDGAETKTGVIVAINHVRTGVHCLRAWRWETLVHSDSLLWAFLRCYIGKIHWRPLYVD